MISVLGERVGFTQLLFHSVPVLTSGFFRRAGAMPVSLQAYGVLVAVALERGELSDPIDRTGSHGGPARFFGIRGARYVLDIFTVAVADAIFRQKIVASWVRDFSTGRGVAWVPIEHEGR